VKAALELYGAPTSVVAEMVTIANQRRRRTPRPSHYEFVSPVFAEYLDLEQEAAILSSYDSEIVSGCCRPRNTCEASSRASSSSSPRRRSKSASRYAWTVRDD
jgi:hypothetical protein